MKKFTRFLYSLRFHTTFQWHQKATKFNWYKKWHDKNYSHIVHVGILGVYIFSVLFTAFGLPGQSYAALTEQNKVISSQTQFELGTLTDANASGDSIQLNSEGLSNSGGGDWNYRKKITIDNSAGGALIDYQVPVDSEKDLVGHWNFDEGTGSVANDSSWSGLNGTLSGSSYWTSSGRYGSSFLGNGSTNYATSALVTNITNNVSLEAWVKWSGSNSLYQLIAYEGSPASNGYGLLVNNGNADKIAVMCGGSGWANTDTVLTVGKWQHLVATRESGVWKIFLDGVSLSVTGNPTPITPTVATYLGGYSTNRFNGSIDEVKIHSKALTATDIDFNLKNTNYTNFFNRAKIDGSDIRFTDSDGKTELPYYLEAFNNSNTGKKSYKLWVKTNISANSSKDVYLYFGNSSATSSSNGENVFIEFDANNSVGGLFGTDLQNSSGFIIEANVTATTIATEGPEIAFDITGNGYEKTNVDYDKNGTYFRRWEYTSAGGVINMQTSASTSYPLSQKKKWKIVVIGNSYSFYFDNQLKLSNTNLPYTHGTTFYGGIVGGDVMTYNDIFIRKYAANEPVITESGGLALMSYKKDITLNTSATGANVATAQYDFPVAVHINSSSMSDATERSHFFGDYNTAGKRVQFWESDESIALDYEVEYYDQATQEAIYWVRVPKVDGNSTTDKIEMAYGRFLGADQDNQTGVWLNGYAAVYHLGDNTVTANAIDSLGVANNAIGLSTSANSVGYIRNGRSTNGTDNALNSIGTDSSLQMSNNTVTISAWVKTTDTQGTIFHRATGSSPWPGYGFSIGPMSGGDEGKPAFWYGNGASYATSTNVVNDGNWHQIAVSWNNINAYNYLDGVSNGIVAKSGTASLSSASVNAAIGSDNIQNSSSRKLNGTLDEVRVSGANRSSDWSKLEYSSTFKNVFNGDSWITFGAEGSGNSVTFSFSATGSYLSPATPNVIDMDWIGDGSWLTANPNFQATVTVPTNTSIDFSARVGRDNAGSIVWDGTAGVGGWVDLGTADSTGIFTGSNTAWDSMPDDLDGYSWRYLQIQAVFNSDGSDTPILSDYTVTYGTDITDPINPTASYVYTDSGKGTGLTNNVSWTNDVTPYLEWTGASDGVGDSGINCFYVYLGTDINADPETAGMEVGGNICHSGTNLDLLSVDTNPLADAVSGDIYYLRIDTKDNAGNIADMPNGQAIFTYKFDDIAPTSPTAVNKTPIGYSSTNSYSFDWTDYVGTDDFSSIAKYQYKTGNPGATWIDIAGTNFTNLSLLPIVNGKNTIYIRAVDGAGNVSDVEADWYKDYFYFSANAPEAPAYLTVDPNSNSVNSFTFKWYKPFMGGYTADGIKGYYYSVNELPSAENSVYLPDPVPYEDPIIDGEPASGTQLTTGAIAAATRQGSDNTFYVVAVDTTDAVNYGNYAEISFEANTAAPGIPGSASIADSSNRESSQWSLTTAWNPSNGSVDHYNIYRSINSNEWSETPIATTSATGYFDSGLTQGETYYYRVTASDNAGSESAPSTVVSDQPTGKYTTPPSIVSGPEATTTAVGARITWSTDRPSSSFVEYSTDTSYELSNGSLTPTTEHVVELSGLTPSNMYNFRVQSLDEERDYNPSVAYSTNFTFATSAAPGISEVKVSDISLSSAIVTWKTTSSASSRIKYGTTSSYGLEIVDESGSSVTTHTIKLDSLSHSTNYNFKITGIDTDNNFMQSDNYVFTTLVYPRVSNVRFEQQKNTATSTIKVTWESNVPLTSVVKYRQADGGETKEVSASKLLISHEMLVSELTDNRDYYMVIEGRDSHGNLASSDQNKVRTDFDTRPPALSNLGSEVSTVGVGTGTKGQVVISWETDEPATSQVEYAIGVAGNYYDLKTQVDTNLTTSHIVIITGLKPSTSYHFRAISGDAANNFGYSDDNSVLTEQATSSVLDLIVNSLQSSIGWLFGAFRFSR